jgi:hypothetical protein
MQIPSSLRAAGLIALALLAAACASLAPPESCGPGSQAEPDQARFAQLFRSVELISAETGLAGALDEDGAAQFLEGEQLQIAVDSLGAARIRACVQERTRAARIAADPEGSVRAGRAFVPLGAFAEGEYVARILVDRVLVRNLVFTVVENQD